jgi:enterochelin esterase-like enzyme/dienelactone hydrolase
MHNSYLEGEENMRRLAIVGGFIGLFVLMLVPAARGQQGMQRYSYGPMNWVDPNHSTPMGTKYETFHSKTINADVSYLIWLPPDYDKDTSKRYPVLYDLHASGGTPARDAPGILRGLEPAISSGQVPPMIVVFPNGLAGNTLYCDSHDGKYPVESVIIKDLIPHIDQTYRTIASREGRAVDGFSMGGFGAAHLGFKYPDVFGAISIMAPPLIEPGMHGLPANAWSRLFPSPWGMGGDMAYWKENDPFELVRKNADEIRDRTYIRLACHEENEHWLAPQCQKLHNLMFDLRIPHAFYYLANVKSHNRGEVLESLGVSAYDFFTTHMNAFKGGLRPGMERGMRPGMGGGQGPRMEPSTGGSDHFPDGSMGRPLPFKGADGTMIEAYFRKPQGPGPFPVIVMLHGGRPHPGAADAMGRATRPPMEDFIKAGWAVYSVGYRPSEKIAIVPIEFDDTVDAIRQLRKPPFVDPNRIGVIGVSHGGQVLARVISRVTVQGAVLEAPAGMDLIADKKAAADGVQVAPVLLRMMDDTEKQLGASAEELEKDPAKYGYTSAFTEVAQVRCPILILNGRNDDNSPIPVVEAYVKKLRAAGKQVQTFLPDNGPHGFFMGNRDLPATREAGPLVMAFFKQCFGQ